MTDIVFIESSYLGGRPDLIKEALMRGYTIENILVEAATSENITLKMSPFQRRKISNSHEQ